MSERPLHEYQVGSPYIPGRTRWVEAIEYNYRQGAHELRMFLAGLTGAEVRQIRQAECEFALVVEPPLIVLLYRFGEAIPWSDAPYTIHMVPAAQRTVPEPTGLQEPHALLQVVLVDATSGIVRGLRTVSWSPAFTTAILLAIREQAAAPFDQREYDRRLGDLYRRYPTSEAMLRLARVRTKGGA